MSLAKPRKIVILVMAGNPVDQTIALLSQYMEVRTFVLLTHLERFGAPLLLACGAILLRLPFIFF